MVKAFYHGRRSSEPLPRTPWDPRAVSDPRLVADELPLVVDERAWVAQGSRPATRTDHALLSRELMDMVRALPRRIRDHETGEDVDVIGDDDMPPDPSEKRGDEARRERVYARPERDVQGGRRGPAVRPALAVPREIEDESTGEVLDVIQDNDPDRPRGWFDLHLHAAGTPWRMS